MKTTGKPSEAQDTYWLHAFVHFSPYPRPTLRCGKWLIFVPREKVDEAWVEVAAALSQGRLGNQAKVSTAKPSPNATDPNDHVICVYTYDSDDVDDVMRVREELRALGFTWKIAYKTDVATLEGKYRAKGHTRISKYYC